MVDSLSQSELDQIAEEFAGAIRAGQNPSVDDYVSRYPQRSEALRNLLASIAMVESLKQQSGSARSGATGQLKVDQLDEYKIIREIGRGGMGVVFEAIHQTLGRRVAIKVLASGALGDSKHLARFKREARAAARLRHSNIVPVFGVGQAGSHHYYVMDFIDGVSLREHLASLTHARADEAPTIDDAVADTNGELLLGRNPRDDTSVRSGYDLAPGRPGDAQYCRWVANMGATVCDAIQYAHTQGVLHRDIKPANLLLDRRGELWIADFGLAKLSEAQAMTATGDVVGTPQYMPPESFEGSYDSRSEIYAVGLTLYEMLTQRPAIEGKGPADVIRKATEGVSVSPRKRNSSIPRDLETIVLKSLAHDPGGRYASAGDMRDDLRRFLADRPIAARRTHLMERAFRWSRREPLAATLTAATFALLFALAAVSATAYFRTRAALGFAKSAQQSAENSLRQRTEALATAEQQRLRAEKNLQVALDAFDQVMRNITDRGIEPDAELLGEVTDTTSPNVSPDDALLLQSLLGFFDDLAANNSEDLLAESAIAARRAGEIYLRLGQLRQSDEALSDALDRYARLSERLHDPELFVARAEIMNELALITGLRGQLARANQMFEDAVKVLSAPGAPTSSAAARFAYAKAHRLFASLGARIGLDDAIASRPGPRRPRGPIGAMLRIRTEDELGAVSEAIRVLEKLIIGDPNSVLYRAELARAYRDEARVALRANRKSQSEKAVRNSIDLFEELLDGNPKSDAIRYELAMTMSSTEAFGINQMLRAVRADQLSSELLETSPSLPRYQALKAQTLDTLASHQQRIGRWVPAERNLANAIEIYETLAAESPELRLYQTQLAKVLESMSDLKARQGDHDAAVDYLRRGVRRLQQTPPPSTDASPVARMQLQRMKQKLNRRKDLGAGE